MNNIKYYHGGKRGIPRNAFILPPIITKARSLAEFGAAGVTRLDRVYVTTEIQAALLYAAGCKNGVIYECEPLGTIEPDPDCRLAGLSYQCEKARVIRIIKPSQSQIDMAIQALLA